MESRWFVSDLFYDHEPAVALVEAGILPASEGGILPPGWKPGLTGSKGWLSPRGRLMGKLHINIGAHRGQESIVRHGAPSTRSAQWRCRGLDSAERVLGAPTARFMGRTHRTAT